VNRRIPFRRAMAVITGALIGLTGALAFLAPASAAEPTPSADLTGTSSCNGGAWKATWKLTTANTNGADGVFSNITLHLGGSGHGDHAIPPRPMTFFVPNGTASGDGEFTEDWLLSGMMFGSAGLRFTVTWHDGGQVHSAAVSARVNAPTGCDWPPPPPPSSATPSASASSSPTTQPSTSASVSPAPAGGQGAASSGGGLPVTGAAAGAVGGVAALLLLVGGFLYVVARRRRVTFTA
jgi:hypothetical protein